MMWAPFIIVIFWHTLAGAEYRAYRLVITNSETGEQKKVTSTLDHLQYKAFFSLGPNEQIAYENSWMCWGNTSHHKPICSPPSENNASL